MRSLEATTPTKRLAMLAAMIGVLAFGACGGSDGTSATEGDDEIASLGTEAEPTSTNDRETPAADELDPEEAMLAYAECMREHGIDMPDPDQGAAVVAALADEDDLLGPEDWEAAEAECRHLLDGLMGDVDPEAMEEMRAQMLAQTECMREQGIEMPDPEFDDRGGVSVSVDEDDDFPDYSEEEWEAAFQACRHVWEGESVDEPVDGPRHRTDDR